MKKKIFLIITVVLVVFSCSESDNGSVDSTDNFDRNAMLINLADNIIVPAFQDLNTKLDDLVIAKNSFNETPNQSNLDNLRDSWLNAYKVWQNVEMFNIGKAEEILFFFQMNTYPANNVDIENNIVSGNADLSHPNNNDAVGFPALDYLLFGVANTDFDIIEKYTTNPDALKYRNYLSDLINQMSSLTQNVLNNWTNSYRNFFVNSTSNTATSAVNKMVNDYIFYYEKGLRANKIGIPAGNFSATPLPEKVEAFYKKNVSKQLSLDALKAVQDLFNGNYYNSTGTGSSYKTYLEYLNRSDLSTLINNQFNTARQKIELLDDSFYDQINTDNTKMTESYDALQAAVVLLKVDMLQAFNISVDFVDADGD